ncbi:Uncharacterised protein [Citrobacter youngae]|nr:Uncharacterised protein [Citrobacter youngae]
MLCQQHGLRQSSAKLDFVIFFAILVFCFVHQSNQKNNSLIFKK